MNKYQFNSVALFMVFNVTYYLELRNIIISYHEFQFLLANLE